MHLTALRGKPSRYAQHTHDNFHRNGTARPTKQGTHPEAGHSPKALTSHQEGPMICHGACQAFSFWGHHAKTSLLLSLLGLL